MIISEKQTSVMLFVMILLFLVCNFPKNIINIYEGYSEIKVRIVFWNLAYIYLFVIIEFWEKGRRLVRCFGDTQSHLSYTKFFP